MSKPPRIADVKWITLGQVVDYLQRVKGITRSRQTIYNWAEDGIKRNIGRTIKLRTTMRAGKWYTTRRWVNDFLDATSRA
jgi:hypothetical protein